MYTVAGVGSDQLLVLCRVQLKTQHKRKIQITYKEELNDEAITDEKIRNIYHKRFTQKIKGIKWWNRNMLEEEENVKKDGVNHWNLVIVVTQKLINRSDFHSM